VAQNAKAGAKAVVVAGDLIRDYNLQQYPIRPATHHEPLPDVALSVTAGGAWYLARLVERACSDVEGVEVSQPAPAPSGGPDGTTRVSQAYQVWSLHERVRNGKGGKRVWRIRDFLGCSRTRDSDSAAPAKVLYAPDDPKAPGVLVLDDLDLGFREDEARWPAALHEKGDPGRIVLKLSGKVGDGTLWKTLMDCFADRLTVVVSAKALRERGAALSEALSWDRTVEEIAREFKEGTSSGDLARCRRVVVHYGGEGAAVFSRRRLEFPEPATDEGAKHPLTPGFVWTEVAEFERFLYHPDELEGMWKAHRPGKTFGALSILTAAMARHELDPGSYPLTMAAGRGLAAIRASHDVGGGTAPDGFSMDAPVEVIGHTLQVPPGQEEADSQDAPKEPASAFACAFPHGWLSDDELKKQKPTQSDLLQDLAGAGFEYVFAKAAETVVRGPDEALRAAPVARYGRYLTADREEIERINAIRNLIAAYQRSPEQRKPLSLAVFGPPGSGKSFAIKQLADELFGANKAVLEFNLSQVRDEDELHTAFHRVRDKSVHGQVPLVFWDEFDTPFDGRPLGWLRYFLAPMQDATFRAGATEHPFGKAIFIFAGGTCHTFEEFDRADEADEGFCRAKGPDFISRLKGFLNVKGPNAIVRDDSCRADGQAPEDLPGPRDEVPCLIRRAIILRVSIELTYPQLIDPDTKEAEVGAGVIRAFLCAKRYRHGARSIAAIVGMSSVADARRYGAAHLPSPDMLSLHVDADNFMEHAREGEWSVPMIEALAEACHEAWHEQKKRHGYTWGPERTDKTHPLMVPYAELDEEGKEGNRVSARVVPAKLAEVGCRIVPANAPGTAITSFPAATRRRLVEIEHDIWLRHHFLQGYAWAQGSDDRIRLHADLAPFHAVPPADQELDYAIVDSILHVLPKKGYKVAKA